MYPLKTTVLALVSLLCAGALAQTWTDCDPTKSDNCPLNTALGVDNYTIDFTKSIMSDTVWNTTAGKIDFADSGAEFTIAQRLDFPTVQTNFYLFFGTVEVIMKAATGQGVVSSIVMQSADLDEVDWEWIGGNDSYVQTNYCGKGNTTSFDRAVWHPVDDAQGQWHNYTTHWTPEKLEWYIDGQIIRTLEYGDANGGHNFPQTPCNVRLGIWPGGDPKNPNGTVEWAGGPIDYKKVPYTMTVKSVRISDASRATQYQYGDRSGSFESIKLLNNTKPIALDGDNSPSASQSMKQKWNGLSQTTKYIILGVVGGVLLLCAAIFAFCCIRQRRRGKHERLIEDAKYEKNTTEVLAYRAGMSRLRSEKLAEVQQYEMGRAGATVYQNNRGQMQPMMGGYSPNPSYARSVGTVGSGRGYQKY